MGTTKTTLSNWFDAGKRQKATHMLVVCDTFNHENYPVYVKKDEYVHDVYDEYHGPNMQKVLEVYSLKKPKEAQLQEVRAFHFD